MEVDDHAKKIMRDINKGHIRGGNSKLKEAYPEAYEELEAELTNNYTIEGLNRYKERMIKGLEMVGYWKSQEVAG